MDDDKTTTYVSEISLAETQTRLPGLLVAYSPMDPGITPYTVIHKVNVAGRGQPWLVLKDRSVSKEHAVFKYINGACIVDDLGSKNGTFVNDVPVDRWRDLKHGDVVRLGKTILVFYDDIVPLRYEPGDELFGMAGRFFTRKLITQLTDAVRFKKRGILLTGPTGTGKELAAHAAAKLLNRDMVIQNAAQFTTEEEAKSSLFGVKQRVFSNVDARDGYIREAHGKVFFLDEAHALSKNTQRSLLRVIEDQRLTRIGELRGKKLDVRFVLATNQPPPHYGLEPDLLARLNVITIPPLAERVVDIPHIFDHVLRSALQEVACDPAPVFAAVTSAYYGKLMTNGFEATNTRGLITVAEGIAALVARNRSPEDALAIAFADLTARSTLMPKPADANDAPATPETPPHPVLTDDKVRELFAALNGNVSAMVKALRALGLASSRKTLTSKIDALGLPRVKRPRRG